MGHSSPGSDYSRGSSSKRKKKNRKRKSRSSSRDSSRRKHGKSRRRSRSRSDSSERGSGSSRRKRSRSRDRSRNYDSRTQSRDTPSRKKKSRDRSPSPVRRKKHVDAVMGLSTGTMRDVMDIVPGFSKMAPAEQSRIRIQRALTAAVETSKTQEIEEDDVTEAKDDNSTVKEQIDRAKAIQSISDDDDDVDFLPSHFRSSTKPKKSLEKANDAVKKSYMERESSHEIAIFGHASMLTLDQARKQKQDADDVALYKAKQRVDILQRDPRSLVAANLLITPAEAAARWRSKLLSLHDRFMKNRQPTP